MKKLQIKIKEIRVKYSLTDVKYIYLMSISASISIHLKLK